MSGTGAAAREWAGDGGAAVARCFGGGGGSGMPRPLTRRGKSDIAAQQLCWTGTATNKQEGWAPRRDRPRDCVQNALHDVFDTHGKIYFLELRLANVFFFFLVSDKRTNLPAPNIKNVFTLQ